MKTAILIALLFTATFFGCKSDPTQSTPETFTDKAEWIYESERYNADGMSLFVTQDTVTILSSTVNNNEKTIEFSDNNSLKLSANGSDWALSQFDPSSTCTSSAFPGISGDTIMKQGNIPTKIDGNVVQAEFIFFIKDVNVPVNVMSGEFNCTVFELDILVEGIIKSKGFLYVSASVGKVLSEDYSMNPKTGTLYLSERRTLIYLK
jgi:hypothetical protein